LPYNEQDPRMTPGPKADGTSIDVLMKMESGSAEAANSGIATLVSADVKNGTLSPEEQTKYMLEVQKDLEEKRKEYPTLTQEDISIHFMKLQKVDGTIRASLYGQVENDKQLTSVHGKSIQLHKGDRLYPMMKDGKLTLVFAREVPSGVKSHKFVEVTQDEVTKVKKYFGIDVKVGEIIVAAINDRGEALGVFIPELGRFAEYQKENDKYVPFVFQRSAETVGSASFGEKAAYDTSVIDTRNQKIKETQPKISNKVTVPTSFPGTVTVEFPAGSKVEMMGGTESLDKVGKLWDYAIVSSFYLGNKRTLYDVPAPIIQTMVKEKIADIQGIDLDQALEQWKTVPLNSPEAMIKIYDMSKGLQNKEGSARWVDVDLRNADIKVIFDPTLAKGSPVWGTGSYYYQTIAKDTKTGRDVITVRFNVGKTLNIAAYESGFMWGVTGLFEMIIQSGRGTTSTQSLGPVNQDQKDPDQQFYIFELQRKAGMDPVSKDKPFILRK